MSDTIRCLIVDDEPIARDILQNYCNYLPLLKVTTACSNALEAKAILQDQPVDLIFLDINMPVLDGLAFLRTLKKPPQVILTTAYKEHALEAFELPVCDYLLKPFSLERFVIAVDKAAERIKTALVEESRKSVANDDEPIFIKADSRIYKVVLKEILYAEANGNYTKIVTVQHTLLPAMTFTAFEALVSGGSFIRLHRSFIINKKKITHIEGNRAFVNHIEIPIGNNYREHFFRELGFGGL